MADQFSYVHRFHTDAVLAGEIEQPTDDLLAAQGLLHQEIQVMGQIISVLDLALQRCWCTEGSSPEGC